MSTRYKDMTGYKVGQLEVIKFSHKKNKSIFWVCKCSCGNEKSINGASLRSKKPTLSCGCLLKSGVPNMNHGMSNTPTYESYRAMRKRCELATDIEFKNYGGRGVTVCKEWDSFEIFLIDMGIRSEGMTLDRKDPNGNYCKSNCRWATPKEQAINRRNSYNITYDGKTKHVSEWSKISGIAVETIKRRLTYGWGIDRAIFTNSTRKKIKNKD